MPKGRLTKRADGLYEKTITINGKKHHFYGKTQREAQEKAFTYKAKAKRGITFGEIADRYYEEYIIEHPSSERYIKAHYRDLVKAFGDASAKDLTPKDWTTYFATIRDKSYKTVLGRKSVAQNIYRFGIINNGLEDNPVEPRRLPPSLVKGGRDIPPPEIIEAVRTRTDLPNALLFLTRLYSGMRRGELLRLQYKDIDRDRRLIHVTKSVYFVGNDPILKEPKTRAGKRDIVLLKPLLEVMPKGKRNDYIFGGRKPWTARMIERRVEAYQDRLGYKVTLHQLRHRFATILYERNIDERMRMDLLGHKNIRTTRDIYTHISTRKKESARKMLDDYLDDKVVTES